MIAQEERMHLDPYVALAGLIVGFTVGMTGMGGGALMTPILVLLFKVQPLAAVSSDLVAAMVMKPVGAGVHFRHGTVNRSLVKWLVIGSVPAAFAGVFVLRALGSGDTVENRIKFLLGVTLLLAAGAMVAKSYLQSVRNRREQSPIRGGRLGGPSFHVKPIPTLIVGLVGGLVVGMTSVGSGSLIIVVLMLLYPMLASRELVGTDLVQAIPLVASAAIAHIIFGDFQLGLTASLLVGSIPGVYIGAKLSSRAPDGVIRPALVFVLLASALKLVDVGTADLAVVMGVFVLLALPLWAIVDAMGKPSRVWYEAGLDRRRWILVLAIGAPFGIGFVAAIVYFAAVRPRLTTKAAQTAVAVWGSDLVAG
jgi:uncharacterized membrane protein YfcA